MECFAIQNKVSRTGGTVTSLKIAKWIAARVSLI